MINLDEQYSKIGHKRFSNMIIKREEKYSDIQDKKENIEIKMERVIKTGNMTDRTYDMYQNKIDKFQSEIDKLDDWVAAARLLFSIEVWNQIVKTGWFIDYGE